MRPYTSAILVAAGAMLWAGCTESALFKSTPPGAKVFVGGQYVGDTPTEYRTRDVVTRPYRVEKVGYGEAEGELKARIAPGRIVGTIFTLGIVAAVRPLMYYTPSVVDVALGPGVGADGDATDVRLYVLKTNQVATGTCDVRGFCNVTFPSGVRCSGEAVRETRGTTKVRSGASVDTAYGFGGGFEARGAFASAGREFPNSQRGVAMLRCPDALIDCRLTLDAASSSGHGDCTDGGGAQYRIMLIAR